MSRRVVNWFVRRGRRMLCPLINHWRRSARLVTLAAGVVGLQYSIVSSANVSNADFFRLVMAEFNGKYKLISSENFDEYMKALGVGMVTRKMANAATPVTEIQVDGDEFYIKTSTTFKTTEIKFKLDQEFEEVTADGRTVKTTIKRDGNKLVQEQTGNKPCTIVREFEGDTMKMVLTCGDVVCTRVYKKEA